MRISLHENSHVKFRVWCVFTVRSCVWCINGLKCVRVCVVWVCVGLCMCGYVCVCVCVCRHCLADGQHVLCAVRVDTRVLSRHRHVRLCESVLFVGVLWDFVGFSK